MSEFIDVPEAHIFQVAYYEHLISKFIEDGLKINKFYEYD